LCVLVTCLASHLVCSAHMFGTFVQALRCFCGGPAQAVVCAVACMLVCVGASFGCCLCVMDTCLASLVFVLCAVDIRLLLCVNGHIFGICNSSSLFCFWQRGKPLFNLVAFNCISSDVISSQSQPVVYTTKHLCHLRCTLVRALSPLTDAPFVAS